MKYSVLASLALVLGLSGQSYSQRRGQPSIPQTPKAAAAIDLTGYWVSIVSEDWKFRMVTPKKGEYNGVPITPEGRKVADAWDPAKDEAAGNQCKNYGAGAIMRVPGRLQITWENDSTLRIDTDAGTQTRLFHFAESQPPSGEPTWQGHSIAQWQYAATGRASRGQPLSLDGNLKVITTRLRPGYVRRNGVPYSGNAVVTDYFERIEAPNGDQWLVVTTEVADPLYLNPPFVTSSNFKKLPDAAGWNPTPCSAK